MDQLERAASGFVEAPTDSNRARTSKAVVSVGSVFGALAASSCCVLPVALFGLGASGAWIGRLGALEPYQPVFIGVTLVFLAVGFYLVYRKPKAVACEPGTACARPLSNRITKIVLWTSAALVIVAFAFPNVTGLFV